jgi:hypothetical protein
MSAPSDLMTQMILAQITDLQRRVTQQDNAIAGLKSEVERLGGNNNRHNSTHTNSYNNNTHSNRREERNMRGVTTYNTNATIPLTHTSYNTSRPNTNTTSTNSKYNDKKRRPNVASSTAEESERAAPIALGTLLKDDEEVTLNIGVAKDSNGDFTYTSCTATFTDGELCITGCEKVSSLVGEKSDKPGTLLYKFMTELKNAGHIQRMFKIAPWKLCSVVRDGKTLTLEQLKGDM